MLERLARSDAHRPALAITRPDRPSGRGRRMTAPPVAERARALAIPLEQPQSVNDPRTVELIARASGASPGGESGGEASDEHAAWGTGGSASAIVVCAFGALIKQPLLSYELLNVHPSLLPRWRGAAPIERAIMAGDVQSGVSIMRLTAGLDSGPVCLASAEPIHPGDTYGSLAGRLQELGGELLVRALEQTPPFLEQPSDGVTYADKLGPADRLLDPTLPALALERTVRALHPHIGARVALADGTLLGVHRAALAEEQESSGGATGACSRSEPSLLARDGRLLLNCTPGVLELLVVQPSGGRAMDAAAYLRGHGLPGRR